MIIVQAELGHQNMVFRIMALTISEAIVLIESSHKDKAFGL
jgi:hypothetical protein